MHCKTCNTRLDSEDAVCPNCGKSSGGPALSDEQPLASARAVPKFASPSALAKLGGIADQSSTAEAKSTSAGKKKLPKRKVKASTPPGRLSATKKSSSPRPAPRVTRPGRKKPSAVPPKPTAPRSAKPSVPTGTAKPGFPAVKMKTSELRELVAARPELLEEGLEVFADGQGRPVGAAYSCEVGEIDLLARVLAVADVFDAATSRRVYRAREPLLPHQIIQELLDDHERLGIDLVIAKALTNLVGVYPVGSCVVLDTREVGIVRGANPDTTQINRPLVRIVYSADGNRLTDGPVVDLAEKGPDGSYGRRILKLADPEKFGITPGDYCV